MLHVDDNRNLYGLVSKNNHDFELTTEFSHLTNPHSENLYLMFVYLKNTTRNIGNIFINVLFICLFIDMAAEEYNAFFYSLVSTVNIVFVP